MPFLEPRKSTMPRIDPIQLLNCLSVLLSEKGGIKSRDEVSRLAGLMTKFSKKLVSKCIYIQILKCTETELLGSFMGSGGWILVHMWLTESIVSQNWPLARELLELLLLCPVDIERLKTNNCPKLVKELSKDGNHFAIRALASKLVEQWLKTVKGEQVVPILLSDIPQILKDAHSDVQPENVKTEIVNNSKNEEISVSNTEKPNIEDQEDVTPSENKIDPPAEVNETKATEDDKEEQEVLPVLKISMKNGKQIVSQVDESINKTSEDESSVEKSRERSKSKNKEKSSEKRSHSSKSSSSKHSSKSHSSSDKHKSSHKSSSSSSKDSHHSSSKDRSKDKDRQSSSHSSKSKSDSNKKSSSSSSSSSSKSKEDRKHSSERDKSRSKEKDDKSEKSKDISKSTEKDDDKPQSPSIHKLGKIPRLSDVKKEKPSISIEVRKPDEPKPKTVKTFHSKFRKHGLEEEVKPPPSRAALSAKKAPPPATPPIPLPKRPSPVRHETPPEKKPKILEPQEKPGSIKLIPAKPKQRGVKGRSRFAFGPTEGSSLPTTAAATSALLRQY